MEVNYSNQLLHVWLFHLESNLVNRTIGCEDSHLVKQWLGSQSNNRFICRACLREGGREGGEGKWMGGEEKHRGRIVLRKDEKLKCKEHTHTLANTPAIVLITFRWEQGGLRLCSDRGNKDSQRYGCREERHVHKEG